MLIKSAAYDPSLEEIAHLLSEDYDIVLADGFRQGNSSKMEVHRKEIGPPLKDIKKRIATVTDEPLETKARQFSPEDIKGLADLLERGFIKLQAEQISPYVNHIRISLTVFPKQVITNVLLAMASCLKGVGEIKRLQSFLKRKLGRD